MTVVIALPISWLSHAKDFQCHPSDRGGPHEDPVDRAAPVGQLMDLHSISRIDVTAQRLRFWLN
jgi:hypothetical protein